MIDLVDVAATMLEESGLAPIRIRPLMDNEEGVCIRRVPSTVTSMYMDGTQEIAYLFELYIRRESEEQAINECETAINTLDMATIASKNGSYRFISCSIYSHLSEVERTAPQHTYKVGFRAEIETQG